MREFSSTGLEARLYGRQDACRYKRSGLYDAHVESPKLQFLSTDTIDTTLSRWDLNHYLHRERLY